MEAVLVLAPRHGLESVSYLAHGHGRTRYPSISAIGVTWPRSITTITGNARILSRAPRAGRGAVGSALDSQNARCAGPRALGKQQIDQRLRPGRVLALAAVPSLPGGSSAFEISNRLATACKLIGIVGYAPIPPPPSGSHERIVSCHQAGDSGQDDCTGDHALTARAIAEAIGDWQYQPKWPPGRILMRAVG